MSKIQLLLDVVDNMRALADSIQAVANTMRENELSQPVEPSPRPEPVKPVPAEPEPIPVPKPVKPITLPELRTALGKLSREGYTDQIRALIQKYGADRLGEVDPSNYGALLKEAEELPHAAK